MTTLSISIILPTYNQARYVSRAIQSVLQQTYTNIELIVVDDGSTDETPHILDTFDDPRVRVIRQDNAGLSAARNAGIRETAAPLVTFLDADDFFLADKLEVLAEYLQAHTDTGLVAGRARYIDDSEATLTDQPPCMSRLDLSELLFDNPICVSGILLRRHWLARVGNFDESLRACEDWDLWLRLSQAGCQMAWVDHLVVAYRTHPGQMTRESDRMRTAMLAMFNKLYNQPGLPEPVVCCRDAVLASALVKAAAYAYHAGEYADAQRDLAEALRLNSALKADHYNRLVELLTRWSFDPRASEPSHFLKQVVAHLPPGQPGLDNPMRKAWAQVLIGSLFQGSRDSRRAHKWDLLTALYHEPGWMFNRGVLRVLAEAWS